MQVVYDVSPTGRSLTPSVLIAIVCALMESNRHGGWIVIPGVIEVDGLDTESALLLVEALLGGNDNGTGLGDRTAGEACSLCTRK